VPANTEAPPTRTVGDAVTRALSHASTYEVARDEEIIAADALVRSRADLLPNLAGSATAFYTSPAPGAPTTPSYLSADAVTWYQASVGLSGTLLGGGVATSLRDRLLLTAAHAGTEIARRELVEATVDAWYGVALAQAQVTAAESDARAAEELARLTRLRFEGAEVAEVDTLRTRLLASERQDDLARARAAASVAISHLLALLGGDAAVAVGELTATPPAANEIEAAAGSSTAEAPTVARARAIAAASRAERVAARARYLPRITYEAAYGVDTDSLDAAGWAHRGFTAGATLLVPFFDWGQGAHEADQALLQADQADAARELAERTVAEERSAATALANTAAERARLLLANLPDAARNVDVSTARYQAGETDLVEVTEAQALLADVRRAAAQALYDYQTALARLRLYAGQ
jgi:outer membrane protein TolC